MIDAFRDRASFGNIAAEPKKFPCRSGPKSPKFPAAEGGELSLWAVLRPGQPPVKSHPPKVLRYPLIDGLGGNFITSRALGSMVSIAVLK